MNYDEDYLGVSNSMHPASEIEVEAETVEFDEIAILQEQVKIQTKRLEYKIWQLKKLAIIEQLVKLLKGTQHPILVSKQTFRNWENEANQPNIRTIEKVIKENDFEVFISDGNLDDLIAFNKKIADKKGLKMNLVFEV